MAPKKRLTAAELMRLSGGWSSDPRRPGPGQGELPFDDQDEQLTLFDTPLPIASTPTSSEGGEFDVIPLNDDGPVSGNPDARPAPLTEVPTSTTNPARPRTVAAGYDKATRTLTTIFRDGTLWNYYEVPPLMWANFKRARSKGRFILTYLNSQPYGPADDGDVNTEAIAALHRAAGIVQVATGGLTGTQKATGRRGSGRSSYGTGNLGGSTRGRAVRDFLNRPG